jgi:hypothetical protein
MAGPGNILIKVGAEAGQAISELTRVNKSLGDTMTTSEKMGAGIKKAAVPAALALGALAVAGVGAAKAAAEDAAEQQKLTGVLERVTGASDAQIAATHDWIDAQALATGVADSELRPALEKIATATGDVTKAQGLMGSALDIAAASGKSVDAVSAAIAKGYTGQTAALEKLIPGLSEAAKESDNFGVIMDELASKTGGAAAESASTAAGQFKIFQLQMSELQEELGAALLPVIQALLPLLRNMAAFAAENTTAIKILIGIVAGLAAGVLVANAAMKVYAAGQVIVKAATAAWTAAQWLLNAALTANPIGIVIVAVAALGAALVIAYHKSETFRNIVNAAFAAVKNAAQAIVGPISSAMNALASGWDKVRDAAGGAAAAISGAISSVRGVIEGLISAVDRLLGAISRIKIPHIPDLNPFMAPATAGAGASGRSGSSRSSSSGITVNVYGAVDPEGTARTIRRILGDQDRRHGRRP